MEAPTTETWTILYSVVAICNLHSPISLPPTASGPGPFFGEDSLSVLSHDVLGAQTGPIAPILTTIDLRAPRSDRATLNPSMGTALRWPFER